MTDDHRDPVVARALRELPVPEHAPDFWARLDARLDAEDGPAEPPADVRVATSELPAVTLLRPEETRVNPRHRQRFLAAAAVVAVAALATGLVLRDGDEPVADVAATTVPTTVPATPAAAPPELPAALAGAEAAVDRWIRALAGGDHREAIALLGPLTRRYLESQGMDVSDFSEGFGSWVTSEDLAVTTVEIPGAGAVVVLSGTRRAEGLEGIEQRTEAVPVAPATSPGSAEPWLVEPLGFSPLTGGRPEMRTPAADFGIGNWVGQPADVVFEATSAAPGARFWFSLDGAGAVPDDDGVHDPPGPLSTGTHLLVVAVVGDGVFGATAGMFVVE